MALQCFGDVAELTALEIKMFYLQKVTSFDKINAKGSIRMSREPSAIHFYNYEHNKL